MDVHDDVVQLGFEDDDGLGELLLQRLLAGTLTVLWEPADLLDDDEVATIEASVGTGLTVLDADGEPACNVEVAEVFRTPWGDPDWRLVAGEGYGTDVDAWRRFAGPSLAAGLAAEDVELTDATELLVQSVQLTSIAEDPRG